MKKGHSSELSCVYGHFSRTKSSQPSIVAKKEERLERQQPWAALEGRKQFDDKSLLPFWSFRGHSSPSN